MKRFFIHITGLLLVLLLFQGCSTQKNTFVTRTYHKVTSKYNILFNATESFNAGVKKVNQNIEDDFTRLIPVYKESDPSVGNMVKSDMENAIIKASKLIEIHSITAKPKRSGRRSQRSREFALQEEFNPLVDDSYLLMGKAWYYQQNYLTAIDNLSFILRKYPDGDARYEAQIWLIRSYTELERFTEAAEVIQSIQNEVDFPRRLEGDLAVATANYYIQQQDYTEAVKFLDIALSRIKGRNENARLQYIQAQLFEELEQPMLAAEAYRKVDKMNPEYRMAFNAKIKAAGIFSDTDDSDKTKRDLRRMLRDKKNVEFRDQIFFALGNIFFREGNREQAISNYRSSVSSSFNNPFQRALSAITLADIYFDVQNYREAQAYYDSAMIIIDDTYPNYQELSKQYRSLTSLVENIVIVEREDSLQKVARMPEAERDELIAQMMEEEQERRFNMENQSLQGLTDQRDFRSNRSRMGMGASGGGGGGWYFYNPQTVAYGKVSFQQRWGQRQLEDDWRRSNKSSVLPEDVEQVAEVGDSVQAVARVEDPLQKSFYTQDLPLSDSLLQVSDNRIRDALYSIGKIYKSEFSNYQRSAEAFEELMRRFPDNIYMLSAYFDLFDLYDLMNDQQKSDDYKNLIISRFPDSKHAQYLINPNYFMELEARNDSLNRVYEETYRNYRRGNYQNVIALALSLKNMQPDSLLFPKIEFMETVAQGTQTDIHNFETMLKGYINKWPEAEPVPLATEILTLIQDSTLADYQKLVEMGYINEEIQNEELLSADRAIDDEFGGRFSYDDDLLHYFVITYPSSANIDVNRLKFDIAN
ncbi:MAG TPA: tetratricopeptide repeat protein, partial [Mariniphaga sp.]|nr:tetratricopeptide repeat protein [Mariniphaga sp.]